MMIKLGGKINTKIVLKKNNNAKIVLKKKKTIKFLKVKLNHLIHNIKCVKTHYSILKIVEVKY